MIISAKVLQCAYSRPMRLIIYIPVHADQFNLYKQNTDTHNKLSKTLNNVFDVSCPIEIIASHVH